MQPYTGGTLRKTTTSFSTQNSLNIVVALCESQRGRWRTEQAQDAREVPQRHGTDHESPLTLCLGKMVMWNGDLVMHPVPNDTSSTQLPASKQKQVDYRHNS